MMAFAFIVCHFHPELAGLAEPEPVPGRHKTAVITVIIPCARRTFQDVTRPQTGRKTGVGPVRPVNPKSETETF